MNSHSDKVPCRKAVTETPSLDIDCIFSYFLNKNRTYILCHPEDIIDQGLIDKINRAVDSRLTGLPIAYIIEKKEFYGRDFFVNPSVLIPKSDTEILVERALYLLKSLVQKVNLKIADICTGSGCIAISLWKEINSDMSNLTFFATDISPEALTVAKKNCLSHSANIEFILGDLLQDKRLIDLDMIVSNPPYVPHSVAKDLLKDGRSEPILALDGDCNGTEDGTGIISRLIPQAYEALRPGGYLVMETGEYNAEITGQLMRENGFVEIYINKDLGGMPRVVEGRKA